MTARGAIDPSVIRSRAIRECILRILSNAYGANPQILVLAAHLHEGLSTGVVRYTREEIDGEIVDLAADGLLAHAEVPTVGTVAEVGYRITSRGRDFVRARFPWGRVDEYTGEQSL